MSRALVIEEAYLRILGRPVDQKRLEHYRAALRAGMGRIDLLLALTQSDELTNKLARAARAKFSPRALLPDRYRELVDRTNGQIGPIFEAQSAHDFDWLETRILEDSTTKTTGGRSTWAARGLFPRLHVDSQGYLLHGHLTWADT